MFEQAPRDHMRLDFRRALEDRQDARIAQDTADRVFEREAVAAMDLQRIVGRRPRQARGKQLGHAGLQIAA